MSKIFVDVKVNFDKEACIKACEDTVVSLASKRGVDEEAIDVVFKEKGKRIDFKNVANDELLYSICIIDYITATYN